VPKRTLYNAFEPGHDFRMSILDALAEHIHIDYHYIFTGQSLRAGGDKSLQTSADNAEEPSSPYLDGQVTPEILEELVFVPHYNVSAEAGSGRLIEDVEPRPFPFRKYWVKNNLHCAVEDLILIRVSGDSMYPTLVSDDTVLIDRSKTSPGTDAIYLVRLDDLYRIKRVQKNPGKKIRLMSDNKLYNDIDVALDDKDVQIIGQVVWRGGKMNGR
jgi:phage repressor protein C with HTH and peptisase S24 domain